MRGMMESGGIRLLVLALVLAVAGEVHARRQENNLSVIPAVLNGAALKPLLGVSVTQLSAFRCNEAGRLTPLTFQVDEINAAGRYVPNFGSGIARDDSPGIIDENDEIVTMLRDWGTDCPAALLSSVRGTVVRSEIRVHYLDAPAVMYFLIAERGLAPDEFLVRYDPASDRVTSSSLTLAWDLAHPAILNEMKTRDLRGRETENILDRLKFRFQAKTIGNLLTLTVTENDIEARLLGVRAGPVRVVRELRTVATPVPGFPIEAAITCLHYDRMLVVTGLYDFPKMAAMFTASMDMTVTMDFQSLKGLTVSTQQVPKGTVVDGKMLDSDRSLSMGSEPWYMANGLGLNLIGVVEVDPEMRGQSSALFIDSETAPRPPERVPGGLPELGYQFLGWENLKARKYIVRGLAIALPGFPEGGGSGFYRAFNAPVNIQTSALKADEPVLSRN